MTKTILLPICISILVVTYSVLTSFTSEKPDENVYIKSEINFKEGSKKNIRKLGNTEYEKAKENKEKDAKKALENQALHFKSAEGYEPIENENTVSGNGVGIKAEIHDLAYAEYQRSLKKGKNIQYRFDIKFSYLKSDKKELSRFMDGPESSRDIFITYLNYDKLASFQMKFVSDFITQNISNGRKFRMKKTKELSMKGKTLLIYKGLISRKLTESKIKSKLSINYKIVNSLDLIDKLLEEEGDKYVVYTPYKLYRIADDARNSPSTTVAGGSPIYSIARFEPVIYDYKNGEFYRAPIVRIPIGGVTRSNCHEFDKETLKAFSKLK